MKYSVERILQDFPGTIIALDGLDKAHAEILLECVEQIQAEKGGVLVAIKNDVWTLSGEWDTNQRKWILQQDVIEIINRHLLAGLPPPPVIKA